MSTFAKGSLALLLSLAACAKDPALQPPTATPGPVVPSDRPAVPPVAPATPTNTTTPANTPLAVTPSSAGHVVIPDACQATTPMEGRRRPHMKNRNPLPDAASPVAFKTMAAWPTPSTADDGKARTSDAVIDDHEAKVWTLDAWVRLAKLADDDCDIHMELSADDADGDRLIVEVPSGPAFQAARQTLADALGRMPSGSGTKPKGLKVRVTGAGFWDSAHWTAHDPIKGHNHGSAAVVSIWELHPVWKVEVLSGTAPVGR